MFVHANLIVIPNIVMNFKIFYIFNNILFRTLDLHVVCNHLLRLTSWSITNTFPDTDVYKLQFERLWVFVLMILRYIWNYHDKNIQKSINMPGIGSLICEIDVNISEIW